MLPFGLTVSAILDLQPTITLVFVLARSWNARQALGGSYNSSRGAAVGLQISIREAADVTILDLRGRATIGHESELLSRQLKKLIANGVRKLLLNLVDVIQVDSSGFSVIIETFVSLKRKSGELKLLRPRGRVLEV